jgi:hypothetical protein
MQGKTLLLLGLGAVLLYSMNKQPATTDDTTTDPGGTQQTSLLQAWVDRIMQTPEWYQLILDKAAASGMTVQQQLEFDANWVIEQGWQL